MVSQDINARKGVMLRRLASIPLLACFLLVSTGIAHALHIHSAHDGHSSEQCIVCQLLTTGAKVTLEEPTAVPMCTDAGFAELPIPDQVPSLQTQFTPCVPRAPPLLAL